MEVRVVGGPSRDRPREGPRSDSGVPTRATSTPTLVFVDLPRPEFPTEGGG